MPTLRYGFVSLSLLLLFATAGARAADALAELGRFSVFEKLDPGRLAGEKVVSARSPALDSPRDLSVQAVYLVPAPLHKAVELHRQWDPARHPELKVYLHGDLSAKPSAAEFAKLNTVLDNHAAHALAAATSKLPDKGELQLSDAEAQSFAKGQPAGAFWSRILLQRASDFAAHGLAGQPPYQAGGQSARVADEVSRLLKEQPKVRAQFRGLIEQTPLGGGAGSLPGSGYWELFDVEGTGALSLGAAYALESRDAAQLLDLQYFASGGYFAYLTLYQMWPVTVNNQPATLVWRGDSLSSLSLGELRGVERMGSGAAMMKEVQRAIGFFQRDSGL